MLQDIIHDVGAREYKLYVKGPGNFRKDIHPEYKANRTQPRPTYLEYAYEYLKDKWQSIDAQDGLETDDHLGIEQTNNDGTIICSIDKDLLQVPGMHYNFVNKSFEEVSETRANYNFWRQMVLGDRSDNIFGFDGKARTQVPQFLLGALKPLEYMTPEDCFKHVYDMYLDNNNEGNFEVNYKLLWILRSPQKEWPFLKQQLETVRASESTQ
jgi:hypothetical protein